MDTRLDKSPLPLSVDDFMSRQNQDTIVVDTRSVAAFSEGFVPGSIFIGSDKKFAEWAESLSLLDKPSLLVTEQGDEQATVNRLAKAGFSNIEGYLEGGFDAWRKAGEKIDLIIEVESDEVAMDMPFDPKMIIVDVRKEVEFANGHVKESVNIPLANMADPANIANIEDSDNVYLLSATGVRGIIAASVLKRQGLHNVRNIAGGWDKLKDEGGIETEKDAAALN
jgi:rhodanese-related sulfurtransferase